MINLRAGSLTLAAAAVLTLGLPASGATIDSGARVETIDSGAWVDAWTASAQPGDLGLRLPGAPIASPFDNQTVRLVVHPQAVGNQVRVKLSNAFGDRPLVVGAGKVARRSTGAGIDPATSRPLAFGGRPTITVPTGAEVLSDPVELRVAVGADLAVDLYLPQPTGVPTWHLAAQQTSYVTAGNHAGDAVLPAANPVRSWFFLTDVAVSTGRGAAGIVALGDSITDGLGSTVDANHRWPNYLADRLGHGRLSVIDEGIAAGRLLHDAVGPSALARFDRDVLAKPSVRYVIIEIGLNDIGAPDAFGRPQERVSAADIEQGYQQLIARAHENGLQIFGATLTPIGGSAYDNPANEAKRQEVNAWLRGGASGFDGIADFDAAVRDPAQPTRLLATYDSGDHLHPTDAGYQAIANAVNLHWFH